MGTAILNIKLKNIDKYNHSRRNSWKEPNLASGDKNKREQFLKEIKESNCWLNNKKALIGFEPFKKISENLKKSQGKI